MKNKNAYAEKLQAKLDLLDAEIDRFAAKAREAKADIQPKFHEEAANLREKHKKAEKELADLNHAEGQAWEDLKAGVDTAWHNLGLAVRRASERFS